MQLIHIRVRNRQTLEGEEPEELTLMTEARWWLKDGCHYLMYDEGELTGMEPGKTLVTIKRGSVSIRRMSEHGSLLEFQEGQIYDTLYGTPYGPLRIRVETHHLNVDLTEMPTGRIEIGYRLDMEDEAMSENDLMIEIM